MAEKVSGEELIALNPTFPDEVYGCLPGIFVECVRMTQKKREKGGVLLIKLNGRGEAVASAGSHATIFLQPSNGVYYGNGTSPGREI